MDNLKNSLNMIHIVIFLCASTYTFVRIYVLTSINDDKISITLVQNKMSLLMSIDNLN
jgi:hypothetical protein